jgi:membrane protease YdiL (CAAX protease family)
MRLFWNAAERRPRTFWRIVLMALIAVALGVLPILLVAEPLTALHRRGLFLPGLGHDAYDHVINMIIGPLLTLALVGSVILAARWIDRRPLAHFGIVLDRAWWRGMALGLATGALVMTIVLAIECAAGWADVTGTLVTRAAGVSLFFSLAFTAEKVVCVGIYEEVISRGYLFRTLSDGIGRPAAAVVSSAVFALLHATNDNASIASTVGLFVNALLFVAALEATGRLSTSIGLHIAWNFFEGAVFGFPVSGDLEGASLIGIRQLGPPLITGGAFGPEAGLIGIAASLAGILLLTRYKQAPARDLQRRHPQPDALP